MSKQYEYRTEELTHMALMDKHTKDFEIDAKALNDMSQQGWNLVCTTPTQLIFKKEVN
ncbi:DUF4177 domain-containing protein [Bacillus toyonensis]|uniref:DUF4177 domain-containing protein n=1 Tax=Bacillus toyonensis TaxID=155322 RepID=UPI001145962C|nr:DUF4177 domain-containing protein [Bacillus toyonensis]